MTIQNIIERIQDLINSDDCNGYLSNSLWQHATKEFTKYADSLRKE